MAAVAKHGESLQHASERLRGKRNVSRPTPRFLRSAAIFENKRNFRAVRRSAFCRSRQELSNEYFLAQFGVDTEENEPFKVWIMWLRNQSKVRYRTFQLSGRPPPLLAPVGRRRGQLLRAPPNLLPRQLHAEVPARSSPGRLATSPPCQVRKCIFRKCIFRKFCKFLAGSFSAVSKRNFARKYAFDSIFQALQDLHPFAPLQSQFVRKKSV